jgi:hypothetical protein
MPDQERLSYAPAGPGTIQACWLCGIRLPGDHMVADGGSACADVRWYCLDKRGCTERWTARSARPGDARLSTAGAPDSWGALSLPAGAPGINGDGRPAVGPGLAADR